MLERIRKSKMNLPDIDLETNCAKCGKPIIFKHNLFLEVEYIKNLISISNDFKKDGYNVFVNLYCFECRSNEDLVEFVYKSNNKTVISYPFQQEFDYMYLEIEDYKFCLDYLKNNDVINNFKNLHSEFKNYYILNRILGIEKYFSLNEIKDALIENIENRYSNQDLKLYYGYAKYKDEIKYINNVLKDFNKYFLSDYKFLSKDYFKIYYLLDDFKNLKEVNLSLEKLCCKAILQLFLGKDYNFDKNDIFNLIETENNFVNKSNLIFIFNQIYLQFGDEIKINYDCYNEIKNIAIASNKNIANELLQKSFKIIKNYN